MRIMIGTLYSGEGDYDKCCESIRNQSVQCDHQIISGYEEAEAHMELYSRFKIQKYDYLIKVDADIVLLKDDAVERLTNFASKRKLDRCSTNVSDFFTRTIMTGIHCYSKKVNWEFDKIVGNTHPDRCDDAKKCFTIQEVMGSHCFYATHIQCFHFGYHRYKKGQMDRIKQIVRHYDDLSPMNDGESKTRIRLACLGALCASKENECYHGYRYNSLYDKMSEYSNKSIDDMDIRALAK